MKDYNQIQDLIDRFMMAETSEAEERELAEFFQNAGSIPPQWEDVAIMMRGFSEAPSGAASRRKEIVSTKTIKMPRLAWVAAASLAIILGISALMARMGSDESLPSIAELVGDCSFENPLPCHSDDECAQMRFLMAVSSVEDPELRNELMDLAVEFDLQQLNREADEYVARMSGNNTNSL